MCIRDRQYSSRGYAYPAMAGPPNKASRVKPELGEYQPRRGNTSHTARSARGRRAPWYPSETGGQAITDPWLQSQRPVPRAGFSCPDRGFGRLESASVHAPVPPRRDRLDAEAGLRPWLRRGLDQVADAGSAQGGAQGPCLLYTSDAADERSS